MGASRDAAPLCRLPILYAGKPYEILVTAPQLDFIAAPPGCLVRVIPYSQLERTFPNLCRDLGLEATALPHLNSVSRGETEIEEFYDDATFNAVGAVYARDVGTFFPRSMGNA